ncbi:DUF378 domain-containing protein [Sporosarcina oncorhynchi]|uniref:DUF378 domain-containing protein n=1 Tax=Sporosarcina oncorhynchi TaxID=3056444 RepID=A0ABZ0L1R7_9BACL|nr:DUF378 domain-containing protein [Sporosarcina sp. T2O-4]WOV86393.1 DUF378 domain-containing protein [Sporosarcina sp. T2O-4]
MENAKKIALAITIIGALNWGVVGLFNYDVVAQFAGGYAKALARLLYFVVGLSGLLSLGLLFDHWRDDQTDPAPIQKVEKV